MRRRASVAAALALGLAFSNAVFATRLICGLT
jgi:hypothetical protein